MKSEAMKKGRVLTWLRKAARDYPLGTMGAVVLAGFTLCGLGAELLTAHDPLHTGLMPPLAVPSASAWLGSDALGRDVFSRMVFGARLSLTVAVASCLLAGSAGLLLGVLGGFIPRWPDALLQRVLDALQSLPLLVVAVVLTAVLNPSLFATVLAIAFPLTPKTARVVRACVLQIRVRPFIDAARTQGLSITRLLVRHLLPNLYTPLMVMVSAQLGIAILLEASLSFLGLGVPDPAPSWGRMLSEISLADATSAPWLLWAPGSAIALLVLGGNLLGDALRDMLDPVSAQPPLAFDTLAAKSLFSNTLSSFHFKNSLMHDRQASASPQVKDSPEHSPDHAAASDPPASSTALLQMEGMCVRFHTRQGTVHAVSDLDLRLERGQTLGLVGESGCGKTVSALSILRLIPCPPGEISAGAIHFQGRQLLAVNEAEMRSIRGNEISMIFQEPMTSLNPVLTVGFQIAEAVRLHQGLSGKEARQKAVEMLQMVRIPEAQQRAREYPHQMSGGMRQRVMIAIALACNPQILIADEPTTALDVTIQAQILELLEDMCLQTSAAVLMITHDLGVIAQTCQRVAVMYAGRKVEEASVHMLFNRPQHPYTLGLLRSLPGNVAGKRLQEISGIVPSLYNLPPGCAFAPRCPYATEQCRHHRPRLESKADGHLAACWHSDKLSS